MQLNMCATPEDYFYKTGRASSFDHTRSGAPNTSFGGLYAQQEMAPHAVAIH